MPSISLENKEVPFLLGGTGTISVNTGHLQPGKALDPSTESLLAVTFGAAGTQGATLGQAGTVKVSISTSASVNLTPVFPDSSAMQTAVLGKYGVGEYFKGGANGDKVVLAFETATAAGAGVAAAFSYAPLTAGVTLDAAGDAAYAYVRAMDRSLPLQQLLIDYFKTVRLPEQADRGTGRPLEPGEAISLQYGGSLKLGAEVAAGFELAGSKSFALGGLALSEKYDLSVVGRIGLTAGVAGRFSILVTADRDLPDWTRVQVRRHRAREFAVAADVSVDFKNQLDLPATADEFLGAVLGVNARNFLNVFQRARELSDFTRLKDATDALGRRFIAEFLGQAFDTLVADTEFTKFQARVNKVLTSYEQVGDRAVALFDRYFDRLEELTGFLDRLAAIEDAALDTLRKELTPERWKMLAQLTGGDPLGFLLRQVTVFGQKLDSAAELRKRAIAALELIRSDAHKEIRELVTLAKADFSLDPFFRELATLDTVAGLQAVANNKIGEFVTRLLGRTLDSATNLKAALEEIRQVLDKIDEFKNKLFDAFSQAANSSYKVALHAQYSRASEQDALVDVIVRPGHPRGPELLRRAGQGDFDEILTANDTDLVRLREGLFTHKARRERAFSVNIVGWHLNYRYSEIHKVITQTDQRLVPSPSGDGITVFTELTLDVDRERQRQQERMHVNFLLRALGESAKVVRAPGRNTTFLVDTLKSLNASYKLEWTDADTSEIELSDYLQFARDLGLDKKGATLAQLGPVLRRAPNGGFGRVAASYDVRFGERALAALLSVTQISAEAEAVIRSTLRRILLANYIKNDELHDVAFAYATQSTFETFREEGFATFGSKFERVFPITVPGIAAPATVVLDRMERNLLSTLYTIEDSMVKAIKGLYKTLTSKASLDPQAFEDKLGDLGSALNAFDSFDQTNNRRGTGVNSIFMVFDALVRLASKDKPASIAVLRFESDVNGAPVEKLFMSDAAAAG